MSSAMDRHLDRGEHRAVVDALVGDEVDHHAGARARAGARLGVGPLDGVDAGQLAGQRRVEVDRPVSGSQPRKLIVRMRIQPASTTQVGREPGDDVGQAGVVVDAGLARRGGATATAAMPASRGAHQGARRRPCRRRRRRPRRRSRRRRRRRGSPAGWSPRRRPAPRAASSERRPPSRVARCTLPLPGTSSPITHVGSAIGALHGGDVVGGADDAPCRCPCSACGTARASSRPVAASRTRRNSGGTGHEPSSIDGVARRRAAPAAGSRAGRHR